MFGVVMSTRARRSAKAEEQRVARAAARSRADNAGVGWEPRLLPKPGVWRRFHLPRQSAWKDLAGEFVGEISIRLLFAGPVALASLVVLWRRGAWGTPDAAENAIVGSAFLCLLAAIVGMVLIYRHVGRHPSRSGTYAGGDGLLFVPVAGPVRLVPWAYIQEFEVVGNPAIGVVAVLRVLTPAASAAIAAGGGGPAGFGSREATVDEAGYGQSPHSVNDSVLLIGVVEEPTDVARTFDALMDRLHDLHVAASAAAGTQTA